MTSLDLMPPSRRIAEVPPDGHLHKGAPPLTRQLQVHRYHPYYLQVAEQNGLQPATTCVA